MRKSKAETARTRNRIVETASDALRRNGISGTSLHELMSEAGMTHGGFYRHFDSKEQLIAEACSRGCDALLDTIRAAGSRSPDACPAGTSPGLAAIADTFLTPEYRDEDAACCPFVSFGSELARADAATRHAATEGMRRAIGLLEQEFHDGDMARMRAIAVFAALIGGGTLARIVDDPAFSDEILQAAKMLICRISRDATEGG
ncbi:TetR/AcrR family transcriptional regulator [Gluconacetobacter tumulicola]|uniref:TetR/AcrR family transcriptional regulator n=1 Tax=Gluconacetobacter tumulicola TaxID=1017177 RepID=A0A7W4JFA3_9PROT|nr:TetR/AcrR family transcriptional regulator [Gluconacetobacter tumulicola]MBB2180226.1 TetR/AcrR family transcriptional regulator [Gluconacetobacter tumulicola]